MRWLRRRGTHVALVAVLLLSLAGSAEAQSGRRHGVEAPVDRIARLEGGTIVPERQPRPVATPGTAGTSLVGSYGLLTAGPDSSRPFGRVLQMDSTLGRPMATRGDTLALYAADPERGLVAHGDVRVVARRRFRGTGDPCGGPGALYDGWAYHVTALRGRALPVPPEDREWIALRGWLRTGPALDVPPLVQARVDTLMGPMLDSAYRRAVIQFGDLYDTTQIRQQIYTPFGDDRTASALQRIVPFRGPAGQIHYVVPITLNDDPSDHGMVTERLLVLDAEGGVVVRRTGTLAVLGAGDLTGDGVDEIITRTGLMVWVNETWTFPPEQALSGGC